MLSLQKQAVPGQEKEVDIMPLQRERLQQKFQEEYARLNEAQKQAVDQIEGPVMVIAGPGTGKTQILSARIGRILLSDAQLDPSNILCLTYTEAGVLAMRRRLQQFIGPDAYRVALYTFHAFCNDVIQDNLSLFERTALDPLSDLERIELLKELIDGFANDHPLKRFRGDVYFEIKGLQSLFSLMKKEGWAPGFICEKIDEYIADLPNRDEYICKRATGNFRKGDVRWDKIEEQKEKMEKLRAACTEFTNYQQLMRSRNRYDFDDMINWVIDAFSNNENLLRNYQERFQYILVDEYQDTSGAQNRIVKLLIDYWDQPNVFVVGDDDQSIYRFQGANVENMMQFAEGYKDLLTVVLVNNYRSAQPILDISKTLIDTNEERLVKKIGGLVKDLKASHPEMMQIVDRPTLAEYETQRDEMTGITNRIAQMLSEGISPSEIAVIYKENKYGDELAGFFLVKGIPYQSRRQLNLLDQPFIRQILLVLDYLASEHHIPYSGDEQLFELLHFKWLGIPPIEIARASIQVSEIRFKGAQASLRQWLLDETNKRQGELFDTGPHPKLKEAILMIEGLIGAVSNETLQTLLEKLIREAGFLAYIMASAERNWLMQLLSGFYEHLKAETRRDPSLTLSAFMDRIALMRREKLTLPLIQVSGSEKGVSLLTCHGAKGLEFDHVFLPGLNSSGWEKKRKPPAGFSYPDTLFASMPAGSDIEELRRLFYVALTRARKSLRISFASHNMEGKELEPSMFLVEIQQTHEMKAQRVVIDKDEQTEFAAMLFAEKAPPVIEQLEAELTDRVLNNFVLSATALNNYLRCPLGFYYQHVVRIPAPKNEAAEFGSAIHYALEQLFRKMLAARAEGTGIAFAALPEFLGYFNWYLNRHRDSFTPQQYAGRLEYGNRILTDYYQANVNDWNKVVVVESMIRNVVVENVPIKGKIDKIEFNGKQATVIDYKTGSPDNAREKFARPGEKNPDGGDYWRQAVFYKILLGLFKPDWLVQSIDFDFVEPDNKKQYKKHRLDVSSIDIELVTAQIKHVWAKISERDFYTGCGKPDCHWCEFVRTNKLSIPVQDIK